MSKTLNATPIETERRYALNEELQQVPGVRDVYFQPPATVRMNYPCIVYERSGGITLYSNDMPYRFRRCYTVTVIDADPDSIIPDYIATHFAMCDADRSYSVDNLYHHVFTLYW